MRASCITLMALMTACAAQPVPHGESKEMPSPQGLGPFDSLDEVEEALCPGIMKSPGAQAQTLPGDVQLDGAAFKAVRAAMEDLKPRNRALPADKVEACFDDESAYDIQIQKRGSHYFISIMLIPERCDPTGVYFDGGVRYVIDAAGHILLKRYDGQR
jgi:hypothetical protein